jgi:type VI secretion system secreted protein VgrG
VPDDGTKPRPTLALENLLDGGRPPKPPAAGAGSGYAANLVARVDSGDALDVRRFGVEQTMSSLFEITLTVLSRDADLDFEAILGRPASFSMHGGPQTFQALRGATLASGPRVWTGLASNIQQIAVDAEGASTYELTIVPQLWLLTQRRNHRMFQQMSELEIAQGILGEWGIAPVVRTRGTCRSREYRVQYGESDYAFVCRMLEEAGISFFFEQGERETVLVLADAPEAGAPRPPIPFRDAPNPARDHEHVTKLHVGQRVRPGRYTLQDHDTRMPANFPLAAEAVASKSGVESRLERFHYVPGAFSFGTDAGDTDPHGDDRGKTRSDAREGEALAAKRLEAKRASARVCSFETNVPGLAPGVVTQIVDHPRSDLAGRPLLIVASSIRGDAAGAWEHRCEARHADAPYRPPLRTKRPKIAGVESATVVGPPGEEIHTDELGRVRVHFHWDRESKMNHESSCWIRVSQPWGGAGYGGSNLPRIGQEVLVDFLGGDPDKPIITGRVYTSLQTTPYKLPDNKTQSGWKSSSSPQTGGYNEIMFEDAAGQELVRMQAEKDLHKLVKNDENVTIGNDRTKLVKNDDSLTVGNDRTKVVQNDENVTIGNDRTKLVQANERDVVGQNRSRTVGVNETVQIGANHSVTVGSAQTVDVGASQDTTIGASQTTNVGGAHALSVGLASAETVGLTKALTVGAAYEVNVGGTMNTNVAMTQSESVGVAKSVTVGETLSIVVGLASLSLEASGKITLAIADGASVVLDGQNVNVTAPSGGTVTIVGGPLVDINPPS